MFEARPETLSLIHRAEQLASMERLGIPLAVRRYQYRMISESYDRVLQDCIARGEDLRAPDDVAVIERRITRAGDAA